jgi:predicted nucleotidyltransferase component of viral defense system
MLHHESVAPETLGLLKSLSGLTSISKFHLVGGTALALQIGHRISVDLDFFRPDDYNVDDLLDEITSKKHSVEILGKKANNLNLYIDGIKVDLLKYNYPLIDTDIEVEGVKMLGKKDIAAMKLSAITNRGDKKDFTDLYFLLKEFSLEEIIALYKRKFKLEEVFHVYKSLVYFDDADMQADLKMLIPAEWEEVKEYFRKLIADL